MNYESIFKCCWSLQTDVHRSELKMSDSEEEVGERQYKIVLVGDQQVGKTAIAHRW